MYIIGTMEPYSSGQSFVDSQKNSMKSYFVHSMEWKMNKECFRFFWEWLFVIKGDMHEIQIIWARKKLRRVFLFFILIFLPEYIKSLKHTAKATNFGWENALCLYMDLPSHMTATKLDKPVQTFTNVAPTRPLVVLMQVPFTIISLSIWSSVISNFSIYISDIFTLRWIMISIYDYNKLHTTDNL